MNKACTIRIAYHDYNPVKVRINKISNDELLGKLLLFTRGGNKFAIDKGARVYLKGAKGDWIRFLDLLVFEFVSGNDNQLVQEWYRN